MLNHIPFVIYAFTAGNKINSQFMEVDRVILANAESAGSSFAVCNYIVDLFLFYDIFKQ